MKIETTIGILSHNRSWQLSQTIAAIRQYLRMPYKIIILDTKSEENHRSHIEQFMAGDIDIVWHDEFLSCLEGRRALLKFVDTPFVVYLDDDIKVGPRWLETLLRALKIHPDAGATVGNIIQEAKGIQSGCRHLVKKDGAVQVYHRNVNFTGPCELCTGGATLYRAEVLRETEFRSEFNGGYEDWDQTLQITRTLGRPIYGTTATCFHNHQQECAGYFADRWRWPELMDAALALWDRWQIRTGVDDVLSHFLKQKIRMTKEQARRVMEIIA